MTLQHIVCPHCFVTNKVPEDRSSKIAKCGKCGDSLFTGKPIPVNSAQFKKMVGYNSIPVVVDFWAEWCGPCRMIGPLINEMSKDFEGKALVGKVNVDQNANVSAQFGVRSIPTVLFIKNGEVVDKSVGAVPKATLEAKLNALL